MMKYSNDTSDDVDLGWIHELAGRSSRPLRRQETNLKVNSNAFMSFTIFSFSTLRVVGFGKPRNIADKLNDPTISFFDHKIFVLVPFSSSEVAE